MENDVIAIIGTNIGLVVAMFLMFLWARAESRADIRMMLGMIDGIQKEMKDFHGRLERLDAEFKAHLMNRGV